MSANRSWYLLSVLQNKITLDILSDTGCTQSLFPVKLYNMILKEYRPLMEDSIAKRVMDFMGKWGCQYLYTIGKERECLVRVINPHNSPKPGYRFTIEANAYAFGVAAPYPIGSILISDQCRQKEITDQALWIAFNAGSFLGSNSYEEAGKVPTSEKKACQEGIPPHLVKMYEESIKMA